MPEPYTPVADPSAPPAAPTQSGETIAQTGDPTSRESVPYPFLSPPSVPGDLGRLGGYRVVKLLGEGGMGFVFRGEDETLLRPVALKVMRPEVAAGGNAHDRFLREGRAAAAIKSDYVAIIHQVGEANGVPFLAMEFLEGSTLEDWLKSRKGPVSPASIAKVARDVLRGLAAAHERGLVHRDIKPANLWLESGTSRIKVLDFGLTRPQDGNENLTAEGTVLGTPSYMAPEQAAGKPVDARADLFSLGVVLYRMLLGKSPFQRNGMLPTLGAVMYDHPPSSATLSGELPAGLSGLIDRLLMKNPDERPASAKAILAELAQLAAHVPTVSEPVPVVYAPPAAADPWSDLGAAEPTEKTERMASQSRERPERSDTPVAHASGSPGKRRPWLLIGSLIVFVAAAVVAAQIVIKIKNKDGTETEIKVPEGAKIEVDGKPVGPKKPESVPRAADDVDGRAADFVLSIGGAVRVNGEDKAIKAAKELPKEAFRLTGVDLIGNKRVTDADLVRFKDSKELTALDLAATNATDVGLANFKDCKKLTTLSVHSSQMGDAGLVHFKDCPNLTSLYLTASKTTDAGLAHFKDCKKLKRLYLGTGLVTDAGLANFKDCKELEVLYLTHTSVSDAGLATFKDSGKLVMLYLNGTRVTDGCIDQLLLYKNLTTLWIGKTKISAAKFEELKKAFPKCRIESDHGTYEPK